MNSLDINQIFEDVQSDNSLLADLDINLLLKTLDNDKTGYLENKTVDDFLKENMEVVKSIDGINKDHIRTLCDKLVSYRYVENLFDLHKGKHIRWIRLNCTDKKLTHGGIVMNITFLDNGTHVLCRNSANKFIQIKFDDCVIFQKFTINEQLILLTYQYMLENEN
jgi:hypothetical protein